MIFSALFVALLVFSGCVATTTDVDRLQGSLRDMERTQTVMQKSQADLMDKLDRLDRSLGVLSERLDENQKKMSNLTQKLDDLHARLGTRMESISQLLSAATTQASVPVPSDLYRSAYADYLAGKTDLALSGFRTFIDRYPSSDLAASAQYYLADCYLQRKDFAQAKAEFDKYLGQSSDLRPSALLKRSYAMAGLGRAADQKTTLQTLIKESPDTSEAQTARQILDTLEEDENPKAKPKPKPEPSKTKEPASKSKP